MNQKDKVNVMNKTTYRYHINAMSISIPTEEQPTSDSSEEEARETTRAA